MPLLLGTKRTHAQTSSDVEDEDGYSHSVRTLASSSSIPTPATTRHAPSNATPENHGPKGRKRKMPRYSIPSESPTNIFRVGNELYYRALKKGPKSLPEKVDTLLELRFQLKGCKVFRTIRVPTSYTFTHIHQLICFVFGWHESEDSYNTHQWEIVKEITHYVRGREGEIKTCREWVELLPASRLEEETQNASSSRRVEGEDKWTLSQVWGSGGVFAERGVIYTRNDKHGSAVDITLVSPSKANKTTNLPWISRARGAPRQEQTSQTPEHLESKTLLLRSFTGPAFERFLNDEITTVLTATELLAVSHLQAQRLARTVRTRSKSYKSPSLSDDDEDEWDEEEIEFNDPRDPPKVQKVLPTTKVDESEDSSD